MHTSSAKKCTHDVTVPKREKIVYKSSSCKIKVLLSEKLLAFKAQDNQQCNHSSRKPNTSYQ